MCELQKFEKLEVERNKYLQSLIIEAFNYGLMEEVDNASIQLGLMELLSKQINRYTSNDSSSVRTEVAQNIFESICYTIGMVLKEKANNEEALIILRNSSIEDLFIKGQEVIKGYIEKSKLLLKEIQGDGLKVNNIAYLDTVFKGIPMFFKLYDYRFEANEASGSIDYPLSFDEMNLSGIEYMYEYLHHLSLENRFVRRFSKEELESLMRGHSKFYREDLINVYELVLANLIARNLLNYEQEGLEITKNDVESLQSILSKLSRDEINTKIENEFDTIALSYGITEYCDKEYLKKAAKNISDRIIYNLSIGKLDKIFIPLNWYEEDEENCSFVDGKQMEDEKLRILIDEIRDCRHTSDKVEIIKAKVTSLADLVEIFDECIFDNEFNTVFELLGNIELAVIKKRLEDMQWFDNTTFHEYKDWQKAFFKYINKG